VVVALEDDLLGLRVQAGVEMGFCCRAATTALTRKGR